jgi:CHAT domain-containing protein
LETTEALAERVRQFLPGAELFHFAGHGAFDGFGAWESRLVLANESSLALGDLLALRPMPAWIVLSACEGGRSSLEAPGEGLGLAQAFILAGAKGVIAANRSVPDQIGRDLMRELYSRWRPGQDLAAAFQHAQLACLDRDPDCASFRLLEP